MSKALDATPSDFATTSATPSAMFPTFSINLLFSSTASFVFLNAFVILSAKAPILSAINVNNLITESMTGIKIVFSGFITTFVITAIVAFDIFFVTV